LVLLRSVQIWVLLGLSYLRDKKVVGVFVRFGDAASVVLLFLIALKETICYKMLFLPFIQ
jgi:hypothetical protein